MDCETAVSIVGTRIKMDIDSAGMQGQPMLQIFSSSRKDLEAPSAGQRCDGRRKAGVTTGLFLVVAGCFHIVVRCLNVCVLR